MGIGLLTFLNSLANFFNNDFVNLVQPCSNPSQQTLFQRGNSDSSETRFLFPSTETEIISSFMNLPNSGCHDINRLQIKPLKLVIYSFAPILTATLNIVFESNLFPERMQGAKVAVIHKKGEINDIFNYRLI